jgi:hypothetical protein
LYELLSAFWSEKRLQKGHSLLPGISLDAMGMDSDVHIQMDGFVAYAGAAAPIGVGPNRFMQQVVASRRVPIRFLGLPRETFAGVR